MNGTAVSSTAKETGNAEYYLVSVAHWPRKNPVEFVGSSDRVTLMLE